MLRVHKVHRVLGRLGAQRTRFSEGSPDIRRAPRVERHATVMVERPVRSSLKGASNDPEGSRVRDAGRPGHGGGQERIQGDDVLLLRRAV